MPGPAGSIISGIIGVVFGVFWIAIVNTGANEIRSGFHSQDNTPVFFIQIFFTLIGLLLIAGSIGGAIYGIVKANQFAQAREVYERERQRLLDSIRQ